MKHKYNIGSILTSMVGYKGLPFPGAFFPPRPNNYEADDFDTPEEAAQQHMLNGTVLYKQAANGLWYFMPVYIKHKDRTIELPNAVLSITGSKNIVETPLVGRKGTVKELISINDYTLSIAAFVHSEDGSYPAEEIAKLKALFAVNESMEIISVFTDLVLDEGDRIVITDIDFPATPGVEDGQAVRIECKTDKEFELTIE